MSGAILLDTCAVIWIAEDADIAAEARAEVSAALAAGEPVMVSAMTAWEVGLLAARGKIVLSRSPDVWFAAFMAAPGLTQAPITPDTLIASSFLPGAPPNDPVDRMLAATARALGCRLMTRDRGLLGYAAAGHMLALEC